MTIIRSPKIITDARLSLAARGLLAWLFEHGDIDEAELATAGPDIAEIRQALGELALLGYVEVEP